MSDINSDSRQRFGRDARSKVYWFGPRRVSNPKPRGDVMANIPSVTLDDICVWCDQLPEDWELSMIWRHGELELNLIDPEGEEVELCDDDLDTREMIQQRIDHARFSDGLSPHFNDEYRP